MKELRRRQSGWVITFLAAVRNDWQSKLVLPREGGRESRATEKCTLARSSFHETASLTVSRVYSFTLSPFCTFFFTRFLYSLFSLAPFLAGNSISFVYLSRASISLPFSQNEARRAENRASLYILRLAVVAPHVRITWDYNTCNRNYRSLPVYGTTINTRTCFAW